MKQEPLLTRIGFRNAVFERDNHRCVVCKAPAVDAHHILERRLWGSSQGYFLSNGASLCAEHHFQAEQTELSVEDIRALAGITNPTICDGLYADESYDKWGNVILPNGMRTRGELFFDESVQKILAGVMELFTHYVKAPRTWHLPESPGLGKNDRILESLKQFIGREGVATVKLDGGSRTMYQDYTHARSLDSRSHDSESWVKAFHAQIQGDIPAEWRVVGEDLYAKRSIHYKNLKSYFYGHSIWNERNVCLSYDETVEWFKLLGIEPCPVLWRGIFDEQVLRKLYQPMFDGDECEGFVYRVTDAFSYGQYATHVGKYVRAGHVTTDSHWRFKQVVANGVRIRSESST